MDLTVLGWDSAWAHAFEDYERKGFMPARVIVQHNHIYTLLTAGRGPSCLLEMRAEVAGKLRHQATGGHELPAV